MLEILWCSKSYDCTKITMINEMPCGYGTIRTTGVRIRHQVSRWACAEVSAAFKVSNIPAQRSQQLPNLSILIVQSCSIQNAPPSLQVLWAARENALADSVSTLPRSMVGWEHLEVVRSTDEGYRSVWDVCVWYLLWITLSWCRRRSTTSGTTTGGEYTWTHYGWQWERRWARKGEDADRCGALSCFPSLIATTQGRTSWWTLKLGSFLPDEIKVRSGLMTQGSGLRSGIGGNWVISFLF